MQDNNFVQYEYKTKTAKAKDQTRVIDLYEAFGWEVTATTPTAVEGVTLSLKRDRKQKHKQELTRLERQAEESYTAIKQLKAAKTQGAKLFSYLFGCISTLIFGGGLCLTMVVERSVPALACGIVLGLVGIALCSVNHLIYRRLITKKTEQLLPVIDDNEEKLANILEKGNSLLSADQI